jgi:hypothetical protein
MTAVSDFDPLVLIDCLAWSSIIVLGVFFYWLFGKDSVMVKVYLTPQERDWLVGHLEDFAYRIAKDDETKTLASDLAQKFRLAPNLDGPATVTCDHCGGTGKIQPISRDGEEPEKTCPRCQGTGQVKS